MRKPMILTLAVLACTICACGSSSVPSAPDSDSGSSVSNPWTDCTDLAQAEEISGLDYPFSESILHESLTATEYRAMAGMIDVAYGTDVTIRIAPDEGVDITGDYNEYPDSNEVDGSGATYTMNGDGDTVYLTTFVYTGMSTVIYTTEGMPQEDIAMIIAEMTMAAEDDSGMAASEAVEETEEYYPEEEEDYRAIDQTAHQPSFIAGSYSSESGWLVDINIYSDPDKGSKEVGTMAIYNESGTILYESPILTVESNWYEMKDYDVNFTVFTTDSNDTCLDVYINGEPNDYYTMDEAYES